MVEERGPLRASLDRLKSYEAELQQCQPAVAKSLIAAWKEQIIEDLMQLFRETDDPRYISNVDRAIALSQGIINSQKSNGGRAKSAA